MCPSQLTHSDMFYINTILRAAVSNRDLEHRAADTAPRHPRPPSLSSAPLRSTSPCPAPAPHAHAHIRHCCYTTLCHAVCQLYSTRSERLQDDTRLISTLAHRFYNWEFLRQSRQFLAQSVSLSNSVVYHALLQQDCNRHHRHANKYSSRCNTVTASRLHKSKGTSTAVPSIQYTE